MEKKKRVFILGLSRSFLAFLVFGFSILGFLLVWGRAPAAVPAGVSGGNRLAEIWSELLNFARIGL